LKHKNIFFRFEKRSSLQQRWRCSCKFQSRKIGSWWHGLVVSSPPATDETGAMGREIESRQGMPFFKLIQFRNYKNETISYNKNIFVCL
jgi:hypothetical protein